MYGLKKIIQIKIDLYLLKVSRIEIFSFLMYLCIKKRYYPQYDIERVISVRKLILIILTIVTIYVVYNNVKAEEIVIPNTAIRLRVIPNSNNLLDQEMKAKVKEYLEANLYKNFANVNNIEEARTMINNNIPKIEEDITSVFNENNYDMNFKVKYGNNYFPKKEYKGITYEEGYYESLVVEIGEAKGDNFWCVLFPSLCLLETEETTEVEYKLGVLELINKIF